MILFRVKGTFESCSEAALFSWLRLSQGRGGRPLMLVEAANVLVNRRRSANGNCLVLWL